ncbi:MAG TPA: MFS transporter [Kiloniellales bacterium]|nr:MFS transporter [Kiloniellales bacterium]
MRMLLLNVGHFLTHFFLLLYPTVVLTLESEAASYGDLLLPATAAWVAFALFTLPAAWAGDRGSKPSLIALFFFGLAAGGVVAGLAEGTLLLTCGLALIGAAAAIYHPVGLSLLVESVAKTGRTIGINGVWGNMGVAAAPLFAAGIAAWLGWRWVFLIAAAIALACGLAQLAMRRSKAQAHSGVTDDPPMPERSVLIRVVIYILGGGLFGGVLFNAITIALPKIVEETLPDLGALGAGAWATLIFTLAAFSQIVSGHLLDRIPARDLAGIIATAMALALAALALLDGWTALVAALFAVVMLFAGIPVGDTLIRRLTPARVRTRAYGLSYLVTFATAAATVPLISWIYEAEGGLEPLLWLLVGAAALDALVAWSLPRAATAPRPLTVPRPA